MKNQLLKTFTNKNGKATWGVNLLPSGEFYFIRAKDRAGYRASREDLLKGFWEGTIPAEVRSFAISHKQ